MFSCTRYGAEVRGTATRMTTPRSGTASPTAVEARGRLTRILNVASIQFSMCCRLPPARLFLFAPYDGFHSRPWKQVLGTAFVVPGLRVRPRRHSHIVVNPWNARSSRAVTAKRHQHQCTFVLDMALATPRNRPPLRCSNHQLSPSTLRLAQSVTVVALQRYQE